MNKSQAEKKIYMYHAVFRVDVNDVKPFQNPTETSPFDHFLDPQSMSRLFLKNTPMVESNFAFLTLFQQFTMEGGGGGQAGYVLTRNDYVIDDYIEPAVI